MDFTYRAYEDLLDVVGSNGYAFTDYDYEGANRCVIMRHDVDYNLGKTIRIAEIENERKVKSTFFIMLTCDFYNVFSLSATKIVERLLSLGHDVGLHFDEMRYPDIKGKPRYISEQIALEASILSQAIGKKITKVSMHRPSKEIIDADIQIPGIINTYSSKFFRDYKYLSDSRRRWREPVLDIIKEKRFERLQILIHPFWYNDIETDLGESIRHFVKDAYFERYNSLNDNFTNLSEIIAIDDLEVTT